MGQAKDLVDRFWRAFESGDLGSLDELMSADAHWRVVWEAADYVKVTSGKIASWHAYWDQVAFLTQLGLMPEPATA